MSKHDLTFLHDLEATIQDRVRNPSADSYTTELLKSGDKRIAQKVGEEAVELALAAVAGDRREILDESADLLYHLLVLLANRSLSLGDAVAVLESRQRI